MVLMSLIKMRVTILLVLGVGSMYSRFELGLRFAITKVIVCISGIIFFLYYLVFRVGTRWIEGFFSIASLSSTLVFPLLCASEKVSLHVILPTGECPLLLLSEAG